MTIRLGLCTNRVAETEKYETVRWVKSGSGCRKMNVTENTQKTGVRQHADHSIIPQRRNSRTGRGHTSTTADFDVKHAGTAVRTTAL
ncbi:MAG: hypothetical protein GY878_03365 [Fuerstiella sp.]|nr:hypothetical protein [Fuerstiella sp.]